MDELQRQQMRTDLPDIKPGDTVKVYVKVIEGTRERIQMYEGVIISRQGGGIGETITVRKMSSGIGVERIFPIHSPKIEKIELSKQGIVRRAKLYYLRSRTGKNARIKERLFWSRTAVRLSATLSLPFLGRFQSERTRRQEFRERDK